jgi:AraC-like DNA-binding protein
MPAELAQYLPLAIESIGINPAQEQVSRPLGYDCYHWLQTVAGEGVMSILGKSVSLPVGSGFLLFPGVPHSYEAKDECWETAFLTFGGPSADAVMSAIGVHESSLFRWLPESGIGRLVEEILVQLENEGDVFGIASSAGTYRFLITLARFGTMPGKRTSDPERLDQLRTVIEWMESRYMDPEIGIEEIAAVLGLSNRRLSGLFQESFGQSPYKYFIQLRLRKAKEQLVRSSPLTIREIAERVGFRDPSHFVATFRRHVGITPEQFRKLH